jgi:hypothetical protein
MQDAEYSKYIDLAIKFSKSYKVEVSDHILDVMASVMMTRDKVRQGGSFSQAVVNNDLFKAVSFADQEVMENIRIIVLAYQYAYFHNY